MTNKSADLSSLIPFAGLRLPIQSCYRCTRVAQILLSHRPVIVDANGQRCRQILAVPVQLSEKKKLWIKLKQILPANVQQNAVASRKDVHSRCRGCPVSRRQINTGSVAAGRPSSRRASSACCFVRGESGVAEHLFRLRSGRPATSAPGCTSQRPGPSRRMSIARTGDWFVTCPSFLLKNWNENLLPNLTNQIK